MLRLLFSTYWPVVIFAFALLGGMARGEDGFCRPSGFCPSRNNPPFQRSQPAPNLPNSGNGHRPSEPAPQFQPPKMAVPSKPSHEVTKPKVAEKPSKRPVAEAENIDSSTKPGTEPFDKNALKRLSTPRASNEVASQTKEYCRGNDDRRQNEFVKTGGKNYTTAKQEVKMKVSRDGGQYYLEANYSGTLVTKDTGNLYTEGTKDFNMVSTDQTGKVISEEKPLSVTPAADGTDYGSKFAQKLRMPITVKPGTFKGHILIQTNMGEKQYVTQFNENRELNQRIDYTLEVKPDLTISISFNMEQRGERPDFDMLRLTASNDPNDVIEECFGEKPAETTSDGEIVGNR